MIIIRYIDLETTYKRKLSGSINQHIKYSLNYNNFKTIQSEDVYSKWLEYSTIKEDNHIYYLNKGIALEDYVLDMELLQDIKELIKIRLKKSIDNIQEKLNTEKATEKQINYANKLYKKVKGEEGTYKLEDYTKGQIAEIIEDLVKESNKTKTKAKVINLFG